VKSVVGLILSKGTMKKFLINLLPLILILVLIPQMTGSVPYSLIQIRKQYNRVEYSAAMEGLRGILGNLQGNDFQRGKFMFARLETDVDRTIEIYKEIISSGTGSLSFAASTELAKIYYALGKYDKAVKVIELVPKSANSSIRMEALYFRGLCYKKMGALNSARKDFLQVDKGEYLYKSYMERAELDMEIGDYKGAIEKYETIGGIHSNPIATFKLGECLEITGDSHKAFEVYHSLSKLFPRSLESPKAIDKMRIFLSMKKDKQEKRKGGGEPLENAGNEKFKSVKVPGTYTIQFGAFQNRENASRVSLSLSDLFLNVRIETKYISPEVKLFRVRVGRYAERKDAENDSLLATDELGLTGKILTIQ
jgi:tetratricopeptide (TPR) repeat protein